MRREMHRTDPPHALRLTPHSMSTTVLAFDFGEIRIGAAVGDTAIGIAHPLTTINAADKKRRYAALDKLVRVFFGGSPRDTVTALLNQEHWTDEELQSLQAQIEQVRKEQGVQRRRS